MRKQQFILDAFTRHHLLSGQPNISIMIYDLNQMHTRMDTDKINSAFIRVSTVHYFLQLVMPRHCACKQWN